MFGGFHFSETMAGTWRPEGGGDERAIRFDVTARARSWLRHLRDRKAELSGRLRMDGLAGNAELQGEITIDPLLGRLIRYEFRFRGDDGQSYRFWGQKDVSFADPVGSMTHLPATISDEQGRTVATAQLKFETSDLPRLISSFRPF